MINVTEMFQGRDQGGDAAGVPDVLGDEFEPGVRGGSGGMPAGRGDLPGVAASEGGSRGGAPPAAAGMATAASAFSCWCRRDSDLGDGAEVAILDGLTSSSLSEAGLVTLANKEAPAPAAETSRLLPALPAAAWLASRSPVLCLLGFRCLVDEGSGSMSTATLQGPPRLT